MTFIPPASYMSTHGAPARRSERATVCGLSTTMSESTDRKRIWLTPETKQLIREHKRADRGETDDDVLRRLALAVEPESARDKILEEDKSTRG